ncbi:MAG: bifunctional phosphopantothenoylcysteine decarboxylase/phosphopantothenate--cysteine ligase CoaBC [Ignavibacteria bacterium]|nr:bifunctional phosphopantothenoylcysteine decarboxylase/phosphopantothenate--cysteine ligase CoaBC [Ignavibacteria bacterium]
MSKFNVLLKVSGSIAAYKSAYLISKLVQAGCDVKVVASESALKFIGTATLEGLSGNPVYTDSFAPTQVMSHIHLVQWADVTVLAPATANTINKFANGISDSLLTSLFLAHDWSKPYLIAPAMNSKMYSHPATKESISKLKSWGVTILPTEVGYLACGDVGEGKLLNPDLIFEEVIKAYASKNKSGTRKKILITYGGTVEDIDGVRFISNMSTGKTGAAIAEELFLCGNEVATMRAKNSVETKFSIESEVFSSFEDYRVKIEKLLAGEQFDVIIHLAALSDYSPTFLEKDNSSFSLPLQGKLASDSDNIKILFKKNVKVIDSLKRLSKNPKVVVFGFKLTNQSAESDIPNIIKKMFADSDIDFVVHNDISGRTASNEQTNFTIYDKALNSTKCVSVLNLAEAIEKITEAKNDIVH